MANDIDERVVAGIWHGQPMSTKPENVNVFKAATEIEQGCVKGYKSIYKGYIEGWKILKLTLSKDCINAGSKAVRLKIALGPHCWNQYFTRLESWVPKVSG